jgi:hypothetical protein
VAFPLTTAAAEPNAPACCHHSQAAIEHHADYEAIASASPFLTHLSLEIPDSATAVPKQMAGVLSACGKLELDLAFRPDRPDTSRSWSMPRSSMVDVSSLAAGTQLLRLQLPLCPRLTSLAALGAMADLQSLNMCLCESVSDLAPLATMVKLQTLDVRGCRAVTDLAPLSTMVNLQSLDIFNSNAVSDLAPLAMVNLQSLSMCSCSAVSDLAPLSTMVNLQSLIMINCGLNCRVRSGAPRSLGKPAKPRHVRLCCVRSGAPRSLGEPAETQNDLLQQGVLTSHPSQLW